MKNSIFYGISASMFFAFTFIFNRSMNLSGGSWVWSGVLRYVFMLPILIIIVIKQNGIKELFLSIKGNMLYWIIWSTVGFGLFYAPLTFASDYGQSWLVAGCWQITIVAGILLTPFFDKKMPLKSLMMSSIILLGVFLIQYEHAAAVSMKDILLCIIPILIAAFSYPLGNRKMMQLCSARLSTTQRVLGMTICSMPFWILLGWYGYIKDGAPSMNQINQSLIVAVFSGVIATLLFFKATEIVKDNMAQLAMVEATQCGEVIFTLIGGILFLGDSIPGTSGIIGLLMIIIGMIINSIFTE